MTNEKTALAEFIENAITAKKFSSDGYVTYDEVIEIAKSFLPTEREQMEKMFSMGKLCGEYLYSATDYFNQNYTQDGK